MKKIEIYAHRGGAGLAPENSLPAFAAALAIGVDVVDMDVVVSKDDIIVVYHDLILNPAYTSDKHGNFVTKLLPIRELNFTDLEAYHVGNLNTGFSYAKLYPEQLSIPNTVIPSLEQAIEYIKELAPSSVRLQIELKRNALKPALSVDPITYANLINDIIVKHSMQNRVEIHSFDWDILHELVKLNPKMITTFISSSRDTGQRTIDLQKICDLGGQGWCPDFLDLTQEKVNDAQKLGLRVVPWTVDKPKDMVRMIEYHVDGIITNRPDILRGLLAARKLLVN